METRIQMTSGLRGIATLGVIVSLVTALSIGLRIQDSPVVQSEDLDDRAASTLSALDHVVDSEAVELGTIVAGFYDARDRLASAERRARTLAVEVARVEGRRRALGVRLSALEHATVGGGRARAELIAQHDAAVAESNYAAARLLRAEERVDAASEEQAQRLARLSRYAVRLNQQAAAGESVSVELVALREQHRELHDSEEYEAILQRLMSAAQEARGLERMVSLITRQPLPLPQTSSHRTQELFDSYNAGADAAFAHAYAESLDCFEGYSSPTRATLRSRYPNGVGQGFWGRVAEFELDSSDGQSEVLVLTFQNFPGPESLRWYWFRWSTEEHITQILGQKFRPAVLENGDLMTTYQTCEANIPIPASARDALAAFLDHRGELLGMLERPDPRGNWVTVVANKGTQEVAAEAAQARRAHLLIAPTDTNRRWRVALGPYTYRDAVAAQAVYRELYHGSGEARSVAAIRLQDICGPMATGTFAEASGHLPIFVCED